MAAQDNPLELPVNTWTLGTDNDVTSLMFVNVGTVAIEAQGTVGAVPPALSDHGIPYEIGKGEQAGRALVDLFPGVAGANRVYFLARDLPGVVRRSHA